MKACVKGDNRILRFGFIVGITSFVVAIVVCQFPECVSSGEELPKDRLLLGKKYDEDLFSEHADPKRTLRCFVCGIIIVTEIEDHSLCESEEHAPFLNDEHSGEVIAAESDVEPDETSEQSPCLRCGAVIPTGSDAYSKCGWSYRQDKSS